MSYHHLSTFERGRIEELTSLGVSNRMIAKRLGRHRSTIDRELRRNKTKTGYHSAFAQMSYHQQRKKSKSKGKRSDELIAIIEEKLSATWSPEQIANTVMLSKISFKTIYNWIYNGSLHCVDSQVLRHKGKHRKADKRSQFSMGMPISERPKEVAHRLVFGHWELDTMVSSRGASKGCFATFIERKSRLYTALLIPDRTASSMLSSISQLYRSLPKQFLRPAPPTEARSLLATARCMQNWDYNSILPMPIPLGKGAAMKTPTACFVSSILRKRTWLK